MKPLRNLPIAFLALIGAALLMTMTTASAQLAGSPKFASVTAQAAPQALARGASGTLVIHLALTPGYHVNAAKPNQPDAIATTFTPSPAPGIKYLKPRFPAEHLVKLSPSTPPSNVYTGDVAISIPFTVTKAAAPGAHSVGGTLTFQACNASMCFPPKQQPVTARISVR
jgi:hypothetical protein